MELIIIALGAVACGYLIRQRIETSRGATANMDQWAEYQERSAARNARRNE